MPLELKQLSDQIIVITGASSGMGLATARMAAARAWCSWPEVRSRWSG
jgi:NAD(P)-dependent dehydrogenase (short-subunit alcohol dehydrogenase family)